MEVRIPEFLNLPPKLLPIITRFNDYKIFLLEGGRGSAKSQSFARLILYLGEKRKLRIVCGRELQTNIEESVMTMLKDLIDKYGLAYDVGAKKITHKWSGTEIKFRGFREQGSVNVKGLEGVDILWIDEAQTITKQTLDILMPTVLRVEGMRMFFSMNRFLREDAVPAYCAGKENVLRIRINYDENPFCPLSMRKEADECRMKSERDYRHIWLGEPIQAADDYLMNFDKLHASYSVVAFGDRVPRQRVIGIDFAAQGNDSSVATVLDRLTNQHWKLSERKVWQESDTMASVGRIVAMIGEMQPDVTIMDIGGMGKPVYDRLCEVGMQIIPFDGGSTGGVETDHYGNWRAQGYYKLREWFDLGWLVMNRKDEEVINQLEHVKMKYRSNGVRMIQPKVDMKKELGYSPDDADSLMMAVCGASYHLKGGATTISQRGSEGVKRINISRRHR